VHVIAADVVGIAIMSDEYILLERIIWRGTSPESVFILFLGGTAG
jgi:hypothetical protein